MAGRSYSDNTFVIKQLIEKQLRVGKEVHLLFIDLKKAYDIIPLIKLWKALEETGISYTLNKTVKELYRKSLSYVKLGGLLSEGFEVTKGLRQGCCISPTLFIDIITGCTEYKYLGSIFTKDGRDTKNIRHRVTQARKIIGTLNAIWWSKDITKNRKKMIYNSMVKSVLIYGAETWSLYEDDRRRINATEMDALRRSARIS